MNFLLDTQLLLWAAGLPRRLPRQVRNQLEDPGNALFYSAASLWEVSIKDSLGRADFHVDPHLLKRGLLDNGWKEIPITGSHALAVQHLPPLHKDPFDRMLLAQATAEGILLLTTDKVLADYPGPVKLV